MKKRRHKNRHGSGAFNKSKSGSTIYLMVHFPLICFWKIGITGVGAVNRAIGIDKAVVGFPIVIFQAIVPGAYFVEQMLHSVLAFVNVRFYDGDGSTEWFWFLCAIIALPVMVGIWAGWLYGIDYVLGTSLLSHIVEFCIGVFCFSIAQTIFGFLRKPA